MNTQTAYNRIKAAFKTRRKLAMDKRDRSCKYRTGNRKNGRGCAVGVLIKDKDYRPEFDGFLPKGQIGQPFDPEILCRELPYLTDVNPKFLKDAQRAHDTTALYEGDTQVESFLNKLKSIATLYDLKP